MTVQLSVLGLQQYCMRKYGSTTYYLDHMDADRSIQDELTACIENAHPSTHKPQEFFSGKEQSKRKPGRQSANITLLEDDQFIYAIRDNTLFTVLSVPGTDPLADMIRNSK